MAIAWIHLIVQSHDSDGGAICVMVQSAKILNAACAGRNWAKAILGASKLSFRYAESPTKLGFGAKDVFQA
ncbi:MAG: hypothetical protein ABJM43_11805 [Paracoccaceae bacterium]